MAIEFHPFPSQIQLQTHSKCNLACTMCPHPALKLNERRERMAWEAFTGIVDEAHAHPTFRGFVLDLQNEPLLDHDLDERIAYIKQTSQGRTFVGITTNGVLLTKERAERLFRAGIDTVVVSANATTAETYQSLVPGNFFERLDANLRACLELPEAKEKLLLSFGYARENRHELETFVRHARENDLRHRVFPLHDRLGLVRGPRFLPIVASNVCRTPFETMAILANGDAVLCCQDWTRARVTGNVFEQKIAEIWQSSEYGDIRRRALTGDLPAKPCDGCKHPVTTTADTASLWEVLRAKPRFLDTDAAKAPAELPRPSDHLVLLPVAGGYKLVDSIGLREVPLGEQSAWLFEALREGTSRQNAADAFAARFEVEPVAAAAWVDTTLAAFETAKLFEKARPAIGALTNLPAYVDGRPARFLRADEESRTIAVRLTAPAEGEVSLRILTANGLVAATTTARVLQATPGGATLEVEAWDDIRLALGTEIAGHPLIVGAA